MRVVVVWKRGVCVCVCLYVFECLSLLRGFWWRVFTDCGCVCMFLNAPLRCVGFGRGFSQIVRV